MKEVSFGFFKEQVDLHISKSIINSDRLFEVDIDKDDIWDIYLSSFPEGTNPIFRERTEHDCSICKNFIRNFGGVVSINNGVLTTIWDIGGIDDTKYEPVAKALSSYVRSLDVCDVFITDQPKIGVDKTFEDSPNGIISWEHFSVVLPKKFVNSNKLSLGGIRGKNRDNRNVFKRSLDEISEDSILTVLDLISQGSLYKGDEWKSILNIFLSHKRKYMDLSSRYDKEIYAWEQFIIVGEVVSKIKNHSIGTLLVDISEGTELDSAVRKYESIVAPSNYKRPKAIFTAKMVKDAEIKITEMGFVNSLGRRFATVEDITVNNILFANRDVMKRISNKNVFSEMCDEVSVKPKSFDKVEEVSIDRFIADILPNVSNIEVMFDNKYSGNLVSLIAPLNNSPTMFKWNNGFSWSYNGNVTDSIKERVKSFGGKVDGVLRFSIQWNDKDDNDDDLDAHCIEPVGNEIYYYRKFNSKTLGVLDVDIINPIGVAVENITWPELVKMEKGNYRFCVHCYTSRNAKSGFTAEIEFNGNIYSFCYNKPLRYNEKVEVADVFLNNGVFSIVEKIPSQFASKNIWGIDTNKFHKVSMFMMSPNYWDNQNGIGNKHYFFILDGCKNPDTPNGFYNEFLNNNLLEHKRVLEALGSKMRVEPSDKQLSGLGFSSTQRNSIVLKVDGNVSRVLKVLI
jgi:hypothetical protein